MNENVNNDFSKIENLKKIRKKFPKPLSIRRLKFVNFLTKGISATEAARMAGYAHPTRVGSRLIRDPIIAEAIAKKEKKATSIAEREFRKRILSNIEIQELWSEFALDDTIPYEIRIRCLELLAKSQAMFSEQIQIHQKVEIENIAQVEFVRMLKNALENQMPDKPVIELKKEEEEGKL